MSFIKFLKSKVFLINILIAILLLILIIFGFFRFLDTYTHHGESLTVPDLTGKSVEEAENIAKSRDLRIEISDSVYHPNLPEGSVVEHTPKPYSQVKRDRRIYISINTSAPPDVEVPSLVDVSLRQAMLMLDSRRLKIGELIYKPDIGQNVVLGMEIDGEAVEAGDKVPQGTEINLLLGDGLAGAKVNVPNLRGLTLEEAMFVLNVSGLNLGSANYDQNVEDSTIARIYNQVPSPTREEDEKISHGEAINVFLTTPDKYEQLKQENRGYWNESDSDPKELLNGTGGF